MHPRRHRRHPALATSMRSRPCCAKPSPPSGPSLTILLYAGEIRHYATREQSRREEPREPRRPPRDDEEIHALRETVAELKDRLDDLLEERRRARY